MKKHDSASYELERAYLPSTLHIYLVTAIILLEVIVVKT